MNEVYEKFYKEEILPQLEKLAQQIAEESLEDVQMLIIQSYFESEDAEHKRSLIGLLSKINEIRGV